MNLSKLFNRLWCPRLKTKPAVTARNGELVQLALTMPKTAEVIAKIGRQCKDRVIINRSCSECNGRGWITWQRANGEIEQVTCLCRSQI